MDFRGVPPMKFTGNVAENWNFWKQRFVTYLQATEITKKEQVTQCAQLLTLIGEEGIRIYNTFTFLEDEKDKLEPLMNKFDGYFHPKKNLTYVRHKFFACKQKEAQTIENFVTELKNLAISCEFGALQNELVKTLFICGIKSPTQRERLLEDADTKTLEQAVQYCMNAQKCKEHGREITNGYGMQEGQSNINVVKKFPQNKCRKCGTRHSYGKCVAFGKHCGACGGTNHFAACCNKAGATGRGQYGGNSTKQGYRKLIFMILGVIILVASVNWMLFIPAIFFMIKLYFVQRLYLPAGRSIRRLEAATRSPIIGYLNSTLEGLAVVRASEQQGRLRTEFDIHQNLFTSVCFMNQTTMRFFTFILDFFGVFFMAGIVLKFLVFSEGTTAGDVGLALTQSTMLASLIQYAVRQLTEIENVMTSVERVLEYADVEPEPKIGKRPADWPSEGTISFKNVCLTYKSDGNTVLKNVSFNIDAGTKLGIVGRTGAGKSSIISTLFRLYDYKGCITIDGEDTSTLNLDLLRSKISIIPQDPILFSGTIRSNIDPFQQFSDKEIWSALEKVHIKSSVATLSQPVKDLASMYSSGQKQLLCLARAVVQNNKIIVLDEATANLDPETDLLLQKTVAECFKECTVLIIAHKLNTVMKCDRIMVLDSGRVAEFDDPQVLIDNSHGILARMLQGEQM